MATTDLHFVAGSLHPTRRGIRWLGGNVDDEVAVDAAAVAIVAGNHTRGTFTCDLCVADDAGTYTFMGFGDKNAVEYVTFSVDGGNIRVVFVKAGPATQINADTPSGSIQAHQVYHIAIVQDGVRLKIYINGIEQTLTWNTETDPAQWFDDLNNIDTAIIGGAISVAGTDAITQEFKGYIGNVRLWSSTNSLAALTKEEVISVMAGGKPQSTYLHNSWDLEFNLTDDGTGADNGTAAGDIIYSDFNEFASRLTFLETVPLTADNISICADGGVGFAYCVLAA